MSDTTGLLALDHRRKMIVYTAVLAGMFMASLDMQIVATALPTIAADLGDLELFGWVGAAYLLATAAVTPFYGKLGDLYGRKPVFMVAIVLFVIGSLACAMAWSMPSLIGARVLQGLGGGGLMTSAFGIMADLFEPRERAKYQGYGSAVFTASGVLGPVLGGVISQSLGWEYIFLINLPIGIAVVAALAVFMPAKSQRQSHKIDFPGGLLLAAAVTMTVFWAEEVLGGRSATPLFYVLPVLIVVAIAGFIVVERRAAEPVLPLRLFKNSTITLALTMSVLTAVTTLGMMNYFALFLQTITGLPPAMAGLLFLPASVGSLLASIGSGILISRSGRYKPYPVAGMALGVVVMLGFSFISATTPLWAIGVLMFLFSIAMGLQMQTLMVAVQGAAPRADVGAASGSLTLARMIGASIGLAANGGLLHSGLLRGEAALPAETVAQLPARVADLTPKAIAALPAEVAHQVVDIFDHAFSTIFYFGAGMFAVGLLLSLFLKDVRLPIHAKGAPAPAAAPVASE